MKTVDQNNCCMVVLTLSKDCRQEHIFDVEDVEITKTQIIINTIYDKRIFPRLSVRTLDVTYMQRRTYEF